MSVMLFAWPVSAQQADTADKQPTQAEIEQYLKQESAKLHPQHGTIDLPGGTAKLTLPADFGISIQKKRNTDS